MCNIKSSQTFSNENIILYEDNKINTLPKELLNTMALSHTSNGVLCKWVGELNGVSCYFKSGSLSSSGYFSNRQPYSELMSYRIGKQLKFPNLIETFLGNLDLCETDKYLEQTIVVSYTKDFKPSKDSGYKGIHHYLTELEIKKNYNNLYGLLSSKFSFAKSEIDIMILFDFIVANIDRHLNNFGFIEYRGDLLFSPLFDNGLSLLSHLDDYELSKMSEFAMKKSLKCKPFSSDPKKQIKLVDFNSLPKDLMESILKTKINWTDVFSGLDLSDFRKEKIMELVEWRLSYVKDLLFEAL